MNDELDFFVPVKKVRKKKEKKLSRAKRFPSNWIVIVSNSFYTQSENYFI
jgi:hypothetical protein